MRAVLRFYGCAVASPWQRQVLRSSHTAPRVPGPCRAGYRNGRGCQSGRLRGWCSLSLPVHRSYFASFAKGTQAGL
eukprot:5102812-Prymnesium_polylepis.1